MFQEQQISSSGIFEQLKLQDLEKGQSIGFIWLRTREIHSEEYGDTIAVQGLKLDLTKKTIDDLCEAAVPTSFIPNTQLKNMINSKQIVEGFAYRLEKAWVRGEKFKDGKKAKGDGYNVFSLKAEPSMLTALKDRLAELEGSAVDTSEEPVTATPDNNNKPKL